ncbi:MAG: ribulose-phosphate 3-epimerase [Bacteroides sp.]|nr:ribulose-phosphate 3-epimerase [Bacillota bacterium]MCM1394317.1 ribulose-phosphate 3-epimerase [[Eubacterium] siraeum]MCM1455664.1 ribulose-phosphate 3-epimerase [Bacteroides sp.]
MKDTKPSSTSLNSAEKTGINNNVIFILNNAITISRLLKEYEMIKVAPSILSADFCKMAEAMDNLKKWHADLVHCDVMDGVYVPNITFGMPMISALRKYTDLPLDAHLMITKPEKYVEQFCKAGADIVTFHPEASDDVLGALETIKSCGKKCGVAVNADQSLDIAVPYLDKIDLLVIMTVQAGFGGQSFKENCLDKARRADEIRKERGLDFLIEIDGGVCPENIRLVKSVGTDIAVAGSAVFKASDPHKAIEAMQI